MLAEQQIADLEHSYRSERDSYPPLSLATAYDQQHAGRLWTSEESPNKPVLARVTLLARHALQLIETSLLSQRLSFVRPAQLFVPSAEGYDLVIQLKSDLIANTLCYDLGSPFLPLSQRNFRLPLAGSNELASIVQQLRVSGSIYRYWYLNYLFLLSLLSFAVGLLGLRSILLQSTWWQRAGHHVATRC